MLPSSIPTPLIGTIFWTFVEVMARNQFFKEIWVAPQEHQTEMWSILTAFLLLIVLLLLHHRTNQAQNREE